LDARDRALFGFIPAKNCSNILTRRGRRIYQMMNPFADLNPFDRESGELNAITDTPKR
jgi:hypothetical protein